MTFRQALARYLTFKERARRLAAPRVRVWLFCSGVMLWNLDR